MSHGFICFLAQIFVVKKMYANLVEFALAIFMKKVK